MAIRKCKTTKLKQRSFNKKLSYRPLALAIAFAISGTLPSTSQAATYSVTSTADSGVGSLRESIGFANATVNVTDIIDFSIPSGSTIFLDTELVITDSITIKGPTLGSPGSIVLDGDLSTRHINASDFAANSGKTIALENITLINGSFDGTGLGFGVGGGSIFVKNANLTLNNSNITGNRTLGSNASGGGIFINAGNASLYQSTVSYNTTTGNFAKGSGINVYQGNVILTKSTVSRNSTMGIYAYAGGLYVKGDATLNLSTISDNSTIGSSAQGGGILVFNGNATITQSTISGNSTTGTTAAEGGGLSAISSDITLTQSTVFDNHSAFGAAGISSNLSFSNRVTLTNSILSGNTNTALGIGGNFNDRNNLTGPYVTATNTFFGDDPAEITDTVNSNSNIFSDSPDLGALQNNGGSVFTHSPNIFSPVLNQGSNSAASSFANDQRGAGFSRFKDNVVDIGSIELQTGATTVINTNNSGPGSLRQAVVDANQAIGADTIEFNVTTGSTINLSSELDITDSTTISGPTAGDPSSLILDGGGNNRHINAGGFPPNSGETITLENLTMQNGQGNDGGAILVDNAELIINHGLISNNSATGVGGGIASDKLTLNSSEVTGNTSVGEGGGISSPKAYINYSKISDNSTSGTYSRGGGLSANTNFVINASTISNNSTSGIFADGGGISSVNTNNDNIIDLSTIYGNSTSGALANGGGIYAKNSPIDLFLSTISGNTTTGTNAKGGGVSIKTDDDSINGLTIFRSNWSTIVNNSAMAGAGGLFWSSRVPSGVILATYTSDIRNTILSGNYSNNTPDNFELSTYIQYGGYLQTDLNVEFSIFGDNVSEITGTNSNNIFTNSHGLGPLQNNGGPALTRLANSGSPSLDNGDLLTFSNFTIDQRNDPTLYPRVINNIIDIGATESVVLPNKGKAITRAEIVKPILQAALIEPITANNPYADVANNSFNADWIETFKAEGLTEGCDTNKFCPNNLVTKEQLAKMIIQVKGLTPTTPTGIFNDVPTNGFNANYIETLLNEEFTTGCAVGPNRFCPKQIVTHEIFNNILNKAFR